LYDISHHPSSDVGVGEAVGEVVTGVGVGVAPPPPPQPIVSFPMLAGSTAWLEWGAPVPFPTVVTCWSTVVQPCPHDLLVNDSKNFTAFARRYFTAFNSARPAFDVVVRRVNQVTWVRAVMEGLMHVRGRVLDEVIYTFAIPIRLWNKFVHAITGNIRVLTELFGHDSNEWREALGGRPPRWLNCFPMPRLRAALRSARVSPQEVRLDRDEWSQLVAMSGAAESWVECRFLDVTFRRARAAAALPPNVVDDFPPLPSCGGVSTTLPPIRSLLPVRYPHAVPPPDMPVEVAEMYAMSHLDTDFQLAARLLQARHRVWQALPMDLWRQRFRRCPGRLTIVHAQPAAAGITVLLLCM